MIAPRRQKSVPNIFHFLRALATFEIIQSVLYPHGEDTLEGEVQDVGDTDKLGETGHIGGDDAEITMLGMAEAGDTTRTHTQVASRRTSQAVGLVLNQLSIRD